METERLLHHKRGWGTRMRARYVVMSERMSHFMCHHILPILSQRKTTPRGPVDPPIRIQPDPISAKHSTGQGIVSTSIGPDCPRRRESNELASWPRSERVVLRPSIWIRKIDGNLFCKRLC